MFGPILPILTYRSLDEALGRIAATPHPLAGFIFSRDRKTIDRFIGELSGGAAVNQVNVHLYIETMPFGGVGPAGIGLTHDARLFQIMRLEGAEIGVALMGTWLRVREQIHSNFLGQHVENGSVDVTHMLQRLAQGFASHDTSIEPTRALEMLAALVQRESNVLAYIDGFWLCFCCDARLCCW